MQILTGAVSGKQRCKMGRLTMKTDFEVSHKDCFLNSCNYRDYMCGKVITMLNKLAHYEDMEEQGRLIELPCKIYIVLGFEDLYDNGNLEKDIYGAFSTIELAKECMHNLTEELDYVHHFGIVAVQIDEFGYK